MIKNLFTPLTNSGYGSGSNHNNFNFTAEIHSQFQYRGGEKLAFASDDDLWVFIDKKLVVDIGGKHGNAAKDVTLKNDICINTDGEGQNTAYTCDKALGLVEGQIYDIDIFYADRGPGEAKLKLSIPGLKQHIPSKCTPLKCTPLVQ